MVTNRPLSMNSPRSRVTEEMTLEAGSSEVRKETLVASPSSLSQETELANCLGYESQARVREKDSLWDSPDRFRRQAHVLMI